MKARADAATLLHRALIDHAAKSHVTLSVSATTTTRWASATFVGARHRLQLAGERSAAFGAWLGALSDADVPIRGHLLADVAVIDQRCADGMVCATIEALTVEEA